MTAGIRNGDGRSRIILASGSASRRMLLANAGLEFEVVPSAFDEDAARGALDTGGVTPGDVAEVLARGKAEEVSGRYPDAVVIGGDQILALDDEIYTKPADMDAARATLLKLRGQTHTLNCGVCIALDGVVTWAHVDTAHMTMRDFSPEWLGRHLAAAGEDVCQSVGAYQLEGAGVQLFEKIEGSYFTILGLPLLPLLGALRGMGAVA
ncbi:MAG: Maf family protein [Pseudomonadota bacterium]